MAEGSWFRGEEERRAGVVGDDTTVVGWRVMDTWRGG